MKVHVDVTHFKTTRRADSPRATADSLTIRQLHPEPDDNGNFEAEVAGSRVRVVAWLKRNGYEQGDYKVVEP